MEDSTHEHHQMVNTKMRLIISFATKDGEALYSQQQDQEPTVTQIMKYLLPNSYHSEVPLHANQNGCYPKVYKQ